MYDTTNISTDINVLDGDGDVGKIMNLIHCLDSFSCNYMVAPHQLSTFKII